MAGIDNIINQQGGAISFPWTEFISRTGISPQRAAFTWDGGTQATVTIDLAFSDWITAGALQAPLCQILGYAVRDNTTGTPKIKRTVPLRHPIYESLLARRIVDVTFLGPAGKAAQGGVLPPYSVWRKARVTVLFQSLPFATYADDDAAFVAGGSTEDLRWCEVKRATSYSAVQRAANTFEWGEGSGAGGQPTAGTDVAQAQPLVLYRGGIEVTWWDIPEDALWPNGVMGKSPNIESIAGRLNNATWNGYPAECVLFENWAPEPLPSPFPLTQQYKLPQRLWKVKLFFKTFEPDFGGAVQHGWNSAPFAGGDGKFYLIQSHVGGNRLYRQGAFGDVFKPN